MRLALYQAPSPAGDIPAGLEVVQQSLMQAASDGIEMLVLPELFLPGYRAVSTVPPTDWENVEPRLSELCRTSGVGLTIGVPEYKGEKIYNTALALDTRGHVLARHRKIQLFGDYEARIFARGESYTTFDFGNRRFGLLICYDAEFPEHVRALARLGCDVILVPTANMMPYINVNTVMIPARAAENAVTVVYANLCGTEGDLTYVGQSGIFGPDGYSIATKGQSAGLAIAELPDETWSEHNLPNTTQLKDLHHVRNGS